MSIELKIKSKHLSEEARIIRFEENKLKRQIDYLKAKRKAIGANEPLGNSEPLCRELNNIASHRRKEVANENRATFLARAYLAGKEYKTVENKRIDDSKFTGYILNRLCKMVNKYGPGKDQIYKKWNNDYKQYVFNKEEWLSLENKIRDWANLPPIKEGAYTRTYYS